MKIKNPNKMQKFKQISLSLMAFALLANSAFAGTTFSKSTIATPVSVGNGGTGMTSITQGYTLYASAGDTLAATANIFVEAGGNVGIGTTAPAGLLDVRGSLCLNGGADCRTTWPSSDTNIWAVTGSDTYYNTGNVGIGTTAPGVKLNINGSGGTDSMIKATYNGNNYGARMWVDSGKAGFFGLSNLAADADAIYLAGDPTENSWFNAGNVGIGTTAPGAKLNLAGTASNAKLRITNSGYPTYYWDMYGEFGSSGSLFFDESYNSVVNTRMVLASGGNVGIGTTAPRAQFVVNGVGQTTAAFADSGNLGAALFLRDTAGGPGNGGAVLFGGATGASDFWFAGIKGLLTNGGTNTTGDLAFSTRNAISDTSLTERMRILANGNVGIGTTAPGAVLDVRGANPQAIIRGSTGVEPRIRLYSDTTSRGALYGSATYGAILLSETNLSLITNGGTGAGNNALVIDISGKVGIGTTAPGTKLDVYGDTNGGIVTRTQNLNAGSGAYVQNTVTTNNGSVTTQMMSTAAGGAGYLTYSGTSGMNIYTTGAYSLNLGTNNVSTKLVINSSGNVGIGTTAPQGKLEINGYGKNTDQMLVVSGYSGATPGPASLLLKSGQGNTENWNIFATGSATPDLVFRHDYGTEYMRITSAGDVCGTDADLSNCASDVRLKENITDYSIGLSEILDLNPRNYYWNEKGQELGLEGDVKNIGFIAQEVEVIVPEWVDERGDGYKKVADGYLKYALVNAVQELKTEKDAEIAELRADNAELKALVCLDYPEAEICE